MAQYLIGYDIADPKRLQRIYRRMTNYATPSRDYVNFPQKGR